MLRRPRLISVAAAACALLALLVLSVALNYAQFALAVASGTMGRADLDLEPYRGQPNCADAEPCASGPIRVMTYNVLCRVCAVPGAEPWSQRVPHLRDTIQRYDADLLGLQELGGAGDLADLAPALRQYAVLSFGLGPLNWADAALFYRRDRFEALDSGQTWLGPDPTVPLGVAWNRLSAPRYLNWVVLRQRSNGFRFVFANVHVDNRPLNREASSRLLRSFLGPVTSVLPVVLTGDFNSGQETERFRRILYTREGAPLFLDARALAAETTVLRDGGDAAVPAPRFRLTQDGILPDHILLAGPVAASVTRWTLDASGYGPGRLLPSDHAAVVADVTLGVVVRRAPSPQFASMALPCTAIANAACCPIAPTSSSSWSPTSSVIPSSCPGASQRASVPAAPSLSSPTW